MTELALPRDLEEVILRYLKETYLGGSPSKASGAASPRTTPFNDKDIRYFSKGADLLSTAFTEERDDIAVNYFNNPVMRSGYLLYFLPVNLLKIGGILREFDPSELIDGQIRILDLGAGPGTASLGLMAHYAQLLQENKIKDAWFDLMLIDQNFPILKDAQNLTRLYGENLAQKFPTFKLSSSVKHFPVRKDSLGRFLRGRKYHFILVSNFLNEIPSMQARADFLEDLAKNHLDPKVGKLIVIEPALKKTSRELQELRDEVVVRRNAAFVHAPCFHDQPCPLNTYNQRDWCHFYFTWKKPGFIEKTDKLIGNQKDFIACSYLVLSRMQRKWEKGFKDPKNTWRSISNLMPSNGKRELVVCGPGGRYHLTRLDKARSADNYKLDDASRGDIVTYKAPDSPFTDHGQLRIEKDGVLDIIRKS